MALPPDFVASLTCPTTDDVLQLIDTKRRSTQRRTFVPIVNELRPVDLFCYLAARFGSPNGVQNFLRNDHSDNLVHWDWTLLYGDTLLAFWGANFRTELWVIGDLTFGDAEKFDLIEQVRADFKHHGSKMASMRGKLERWSEFVNPYWRLTRAITRLQAELASLDLESKFASGYNSPITAENESALWAQLSGRYNQAFGLCFGIRSMLPVWAEAFVNLVIFVQARKDIKDDPRLYDNLIRQPIDIRIKSLHINCLGFERPIDYTHSACKNFHTLVNERNDLLHGNISPEKQKFNEVFFLGRVPVFKEYRSLWERTIAVDSKAVGLDRLSDEVATVKAFTDYLLSCLKPKTREMMAAIAEKRDLAKNHEDGRLGVLFTNHLVDSRPGPENI